MNDIGVRIPRYKFVALENVKMATEKAPTRDELMEELSKKGINNLVELLDAIMPDETGGFTINQTNGIYPQDSNPDPGNLARRQGGPRWSP